MTFFKISAENKLSDRNKLSIQLMEMFIKMDQEMGKCYVMLFQCLMKRFDTIQSYIFFELEKTRYIVYKILVQQGYYNSLK